MTEQQKHTAEPWVAVDSDAHDHVFDNDRKRICGIYGGVVHSEVGRANRDRIVACVNALAGIPDPAAFVAQAKAVREAAHKSLDQFAYMVKLADDDDRVAYLNTGAECRSRMEELSTALAATEVKL